VVHGARSFQRAASRINFAFNWFYTDAKDIAYYQSGWYPQRARRTSPDFPIWGTGQYDWRGFDPNLKQEKLLPYAAHPNVVNQPSIVSWNNKQAPKWAAADDNFHYGSIFRSQLLSEPIDRALRAGRKLRLERLVQIMQEAATQDLRGVKLLPVLLSAVGKPHDARLAAAVKLLRGWHRRGAHRRDLNKDGHYDDDAAVTLMDAWWPRLRSAVFEPVMGKPLFAQMMEMLPPDEPLSAVFHQPPYFEIDWWGLVSKDVRTVMGRRAPRGHYSRLYCGGGSRAGCRNRLRRSLRAALGVSKQTLYGSDSTCASSGRVEASCSDETRSTSASGVAIPAFPYLNRPTFQQTVELGRKLAR
jgi:acyl-homoserine lactone acylase PvdQ